jgi:exosortase/archaeosortase family protein
VAAPDARAQERAMKLRTVFAVPALERSLLHCRPVWIAPIGWLALQAAALWPHGAWVARRAFDGSDDPLGLAAALLLAWLVWRLAPRLRPHPRLAWLAAAGSMTALATVAPLLASPLVGATLASLALAAALAAWLPAGVARLPLAGLAVLALPLVSSLQFYVGYPLRALTAQLSAWGLQAVGIDAARSGASMLVRGQLVIVDAPCSGVQMAWIAYFVACGVAAIERQPDARFARRLPLVGLLVLVGNTLRNAVLVALESRPQGLSAGVHQAIGLVALLVVCVLVVRVMNQGAADARAA